MALLTLQAVSLGFGGPALLDGADLQIEPGERICLIGRNGAGKSTLLKLINGDLPPDSGTITRTPGIKTALLNQEVPPELTGSVYDCVAAGLPPGDARQRDQQVRTILSRMNLDDQADCGALSAGLKRRVGLARALAAAPDILLLDEPTNHLDIDAILWMEQFLLRSGGTLLFVTHDRAFLKKLATRIVEIDRAKLRSFPGDYEIYLDRRRELIESEAAQNAKFDKHLKQEEAWLRQGVKARRTRNEGRVRALLAMRAEVERRRAGIGSLRAVLQEAERSGRLIIEAKAVRFAYDERVIVDDLFATVMRGDKVGIIGPNGSGKTTLLRLLLGELAPRSGTLRHGVRLQVAYYDQLRAQLDESKTLQQNIVDDGDTVIVNGKPRHVIGYLQDFLFTPAQARAPITTLSGGERNRLLLARLFTQPSNLLVLDEPTNDLDVEALELLEAMLIDYTGTVLLVSHDRTFLNDVATSTLVFEGEGRFSEYVGGYDDWLRQRPPETEGKPAPKEKKGKPRAPIASPRKLTFKEQRERESLPEAIEAIEQERQALYTALADPALYKSAGAEVAGMQSRLDQLEQDLTAAYARWEWLEEKAGV
ncbi:MAG: ATP-binding cassette domain-containing protein [Deltaproteobacteria bacterium]|nr:ATP-binding cassette domain-containing protein [Deltaproteobacteria bacterium]